MFLNLFLSPLPVLHHFLLHLSLCYLTTSTLPCHYLSFLSSELCAHWYPCISFLRLSKHMKNKLSHANSLSTETCPLTCPRKQLKHHTSIHCISTTFLKQWEIKQMYANWGLKMMFLEIWLKSVASNGKHTICSGHTYEGAGITQSLKWDIRTPGSHGKQMLASCWLVRCFTYKMSYNTGLDLQVPEHN